MLKKKKKKSFLLFYKLDAHPDQESTSFHTRREFTQLDFENPESGNNRGDCSTPLSV